MLFLWLLPEPALVSGTNQTRGGRTRTRRQKALSLRVAIFVEKASEKSIPGFSGTIPIRLPFSSKKVSEKRIPGFSGAIPIRLSFSSKKVFEKRIPRKTGGYTKKRER